MPAKVNVRQDEPAWDMTHRWIQVQDAHLPAANGLANRIRFGPIVISLEISVLKELSRLNGSLKLLGTDEPVLVAVSLVWAYLP